MGSGFKARTPELLNVTYGEILSAAERPDIVSESERPAGPSRGLHCPQPLQNDRVGTLKMQFVKNSRASHAKPRNSQPVKSVEKISFC